ncbi:MAG: radical SAM protein [Clostridia bacterium]|nr:radical SAM protein [Clostridia bacterium]
MNCNLCPRNCNVDRQLKSGFCGASDVLISRVAPHMWEEPCISGQKGSGTIFFAGCNLRCRFCQNYDITVETHGVSVTIEQLADLFLHVQSLGVANINLVTASHFADKVALALKLAKPHLTIPVVYNTSSYEKVDTIRLFEGLVDVYLPDLKFCDQMLANNFASAPNYFDVATKAIAEMRRQQPVDRFDNGYMTNGVIVRHLVLPGCVEDSKRILDWLANFDSAIHVSIMSQYFPARTDALYPQLNRKLFKHEYQSVCDYFANIGLTNGFTQDVSSATVDYLPDFTDDDVIAILSNMHKKFSK